MNATDHDSLVSALCANPMDRLTRNVLADYLDETGDAAGAARQRELARCRFFSPGWNGTQSTVYVVGADLDWIDFCAEFPAQEKTRFQQVGADRIADIDGYRAVWSVFVEDCFDPPVALVGADNASDAEEAFLECFPDADVAEEDLPDYGVDADGNPDGSDSDYLRSTPRGMADSESVMMYELRELDPLPRSED